ncbi:MAG: S8 family serine peptidase [Alistipes senegalensis]|nr:S8 family serine peptidase [Bacteroides cellulosilyticus]MCM1352608.1 S8 family serine peptidase [Alistipes senegalensis]
MSRRKLLEKVGLLSALLLWGACSENPVDEMPASPVESRVEEKLVLSSEHAVSGSLLVRFDAGAVRQIEQAADAVTRAGGVATRSGIADFDEVLVGIGVQSLQRLFPVDPRHEERMREAGLHRWYVVGFDERADLDRVAREMARVAEVDKVEFNQQLLHVSCGKAVPLTDALQTAPVTRADAAFNDPHLGLQWHFINGGNTAIYSGIKAGADVNCAEAWPICTGDPRVVVAVVDDCVQWDHPDLAANMWVNAGEKEDGTDSDGNGFVDDLHGYNFADNTPLAVSTEGDAVDHGTHIAGTIAAVNGNGLGVCGIAGGSGRNDGVKIMSCQIFHNDKGGTAAITARAIAYAANNGASILQCSFGYNGGAITSDSEYEKAATAEKDAIDYFVRTQNCDAVDGGIVIFAAGNEAFGLSSYPGAYRSYISVTSMSCDYTPAYYTNYGPGCNIAAPGGDVYQSYLEKKKDYYSEVLSTLNDGQYGYMQGTSMACPHVSGVAALGLSHALQQGKKFTQKEFVAMLLTSVNDVNRYCTGTKQYVNDAGGLATLDLSRFKNNMGSGYIDAFQLLMQIRGITCLPVPVGEQVLLDLTPYLGDGNLNMRVVKAEIDAADRTRLGITSEPKVFSNRIILTCTQSGSAIMRVTLLAGKGNDNGVSGLTITKEYALVARAFRPQNDGWF